MENPKLSLNEQIQQKVEKILSECDTLGLIYICRRIHEPGGKKFITKQVIEILEKNQEFTFDQALAQLEVQLTDAELY